MLPVILPLIFVMSCSTASELNCEDDYPTGWNFVDYENDALESTFISDRISPALSFAAAGAACSAVDLGLSFLASDDGADSPVFWGDVDGAGLVVHTIIHGSIRIVKLYVHQVDFKRFSLQDTYVN